MIQRPNLSSLLLSLLDEDCLDELLIKKQNPPRRFYDHKSMFFIEDNHVKVDKIEFKKELKVDDDYLKFSELSKSPDFWGEYQLEKGSIIWKVKIEEMDKQKINPEEDNLNKLIFRFDTHISYFKYLVDHICNKLNDQTSKIEELEKDLISCAKDLIKLLTNIKKSAWNLYHRESNDNLVKKFNYWEIEIKNSMKQITGTEKLERLKRFNVFIKLIDDLTEWKLDNIKMELKNFFIKQINKIRLEEPAEANIKIERLLESFTNVIQMTDFEDLEFIKWIEKLNDKEIKELVNDFEEYIGKESIKLKNGFIDSKKLVEDIINDIENLLSTDYFEKITKTKKSVNGFIESIEDIERNKFKKSLNYFVEEIKKKQIEELKRDYPINYKGITNIKEDLKKDMEITSDTKDTIKWKIKIKVVEKFIEVINNIKEEEEEGSIDKIEEFVKNFLVNIGLVKNLIKIDDESKFEELEELVRDFIRKIQMIKIY